MRKRFLTLIFTITAMLTCIFGLSACGNEPPILESISVTGETEVYVDEFRYSDYTITAKYNDNSTKTATLTADNLSADDQAKLTTIGTHSLIESEKGSVVPVYVLIPDGIIDKKPVAITLQGHSSGFHNSIGEPKSEKENEYALGRGQFAVQAVKRGYIAVAIEQRGMGERRPVSNMKDMSPMCTYEAMTALSLGRTILGERMWDVSRVIDSLSNFPECDMENIFITGNSGGGTMSFYAACYDERIKLSAPSCAFCSYKASIMDIFHCACNYIPNVMTWFEMEDLACLIAPRKLLVIAGRDDNIFPIQGVRSAFENVKNIYAAFDVPDKCKMIETDKGHWWCEDYVWDNIKKLL